MQNILDKQIQILKEKIKVYFQDIPNNFQSDIENYFNAPSKYLRTKLLCLSQLGLKQDINETILNLAVAIEFAHNASLLHDDVIDDAKIRRTLPSFNVKTSAKIAILTGDWIIAQIMKILNEINNQEIYTLFTQAISNMSLGEIEQFYNKFKMPTLEEYYKKNLQKTGELFKIAIISPLILNNKTENLKTAIKFANIYANAFQINDDIKNYFNKSKDKPNKTDEQQGIFTLPLILKEQNKNANLYEECCKILEHQVKLAIENLDFVEDNTVKETMISICKKLLEDV